MKNKLLVAVDAENSSWKIVDYVARACAGVVGEGLAIVVFHVLPPFPGYGLTRGVNVNIGDVLDWFESQTRAEATELLAKMKDRLVQAGIKPEFVTTEIAKERGMIAPQILQAAAEHKCDTIVVGRHRKSMVRAFLLGSVVEHLLRNPVGFAIWVIE
jgi:nucleotide-binding universal stress UspA family protein